MLEVCTCSGILLCDTGYKQSYLLNTMMEEWGVYNIKLLSLHIGQTIEKRDTHNIGERYIYNCINEMVDGFDVSNC